MDNHHQTHAKYPKRIGGGGSKIKCISNNRRNILVKCIQYYFFVLQNLDQFSLYMIV